jgi:hypothetical protein
MRADQLTFITANPEAFRKLVVSYAIGHALTVRGWGPDNPAPGSLIDRVVPIVERAADARVDAALAALPGSAAPFESFMEMVQTLGQLAVEETQEAASSEAGASQEQIAEVRSVASFVIANLLEPANKKTGRLRRAFRSKDEAAGIEASVVGVTNGVIAAQAYLAGHPDGLLEAKQLLRRVVEGLERYSGEVAGIDDAFNLLGGPGKEAVNRSRFSRDDEWHGGCVAYRRWYCVGALALITKRS